MPKIEDENAIIEATSATNANHDKIETWFKEFFHNSIISANTEIYNWCHNAKQELKKLF